jgi:hypothetical protein
MQVQAQDPMSEWFAVHLTRVGRDAFADMDERRYARKELLRITAGVIMRLVWPMSEADVQLRLALESEDQDAIEASVSYCQGRAYCLGPRRPYPQGCAKRARISS